MVHHNCFTTSKTQCTPLLCNNARGSPSCSLICVKIRSVTYIVAVFTPIVMNALEKRGFLSRYPWSVAPIQLALLGICLTFATPMCCALFSQRISISVSSLEAELQVIVYCTQYYGTLIEPTVNKDKHSTVLQLRSHYLYVVRNII
jgi:hypothetical protein